MRVTGRCRQQTLYCWRRCRVAPFQLCLALETQMEPLFCRCYLDAELLNALVLRRDCCSVSAVKALQVGALMLKGCYS